MNVLINSIYAFLGALGFGIIFNIRGKNLFYAALGGFFSQVVYSFSAPLFPFDIGQYFLAAAFVSLYAECMAMLRKVPVTIFLVTSMIPLVPGGLLFYMMRHFITGETAPGVEAGLYAFQIAGAVAMGILLMSFIVKGVKKLLGVGFNHHSQKRS